MSCVWGTRLSDLSEEELMSTTRTIAQDNLILLATVGSGAHGLALEGTDDHDEMGVCLEPPSHVIGLHQFEQDVFRTKPEGVRSEHGDTDRTIYCHHPDSRVLTTSLEWIAISDLDPGDSVISFDEQDATAGRHRHFKTGTIVATETRIMERCRVITSGGETIVTPDHSFLIRNRVTAPRFRWIQANELHPGDGICWMPTWDTNGSWEAGYLAGQFDGEASLSFAGWGSRIGWAQLAQSPDVVYVEGLLNGLGFSTRTDGPGQSGCIQIHIAGNWIERMRFLGSIRPRRLLRHPEIERLWDRSLRACSEVLVLGIEPLERGEMVAMEVDARTYIADGCLTHNSARKFCRLALNGNPSIITLLYAPPDLVTDPGQSLLDLRPAFSARRAGTAFLGYMTQQRQRLLGERGQMNVKRPELTEKYGFDTKYAMHMLRLGCQGVEFLETGKLTLPMPEPDRTFIRSVRTGEVELNEVLTRAGELERRVEDLLDTSPLPEQPDYDAVNDWLVRIYLEAWEAD